jgi:hypothetical protein
VNAKVSLIDTPSQQAIAKAAQEFVVEDARGRRITLKKPAVLAQYRLIEVAGETAKNEVYMGMVLPLIFVTAIDEEAVYQPTTKLQLEALITRLDEDGIEAVMKGCKAHFGASVDPEVDKAAIKK